MTKTRKPLQPRNARFKPPGPLPSQVDPYLAGYAAFVAGDPITRSRGPSKEANDLWRGGWADAKADKADGQLAMGEIRRIA